MPDVRVHRVMSRDEATHLVGTEVPVPYEASLPRPRVGDPVWIRDADTGGIVGIITALSPEDRARLRGAVVATNTTSKVARMKRKTLLNARTFGWGPKKIITRYESCHPTSMVRDHPAEHRILTRLSVTLADEFRTLMPERAAHDEAALSVVHDDWRMEEGSLWTAGVINDTAMLPYHRDKQNLPTWSAMPSLRRGVDGGHLHLPEYNLVFPCRDGDVTWFLGRELVHGVTPMRKRRPDGYRYTIVYYAISAMKDCATYAEETRQLAARRTTREKGMTEEARAKLIADYADVVNTQGTLAPDSPEDPG
jgi:hypothetical protein